MGLEWMLGYHQLFKTACFQLVVKAAAFGLACYVNLTLDWNEGSAVTDTAAQCCICHLLSANNAAISHRFQVIAE